MVTEAMKLKDTCSLEEIDKSRQHIKKTEILLCQEPERNIPLVTKVARHTQRRDRASGVRPDILEHLPPQKPESTYFIALCSHL